MSKTIKGYITGTDNGPGYELGSGAGFCDFWESGNLGGAKTPATIIIGDEPVFTEAQVKAMLNELLDQSERDASMSTVIRAVNVTHLAHKHGITL